MEGEKAKLQWGLSACDLEKVQPRLLSLGYRNPRGSGLGERSLSRGGDEPQGDSLPLPVQ